MKKNNNQKYVKILKVNLHLPASMYAQTRINQLIIITIKFIKWTYGIKTVFWNIDCK